MASFQAQYGRFVLPLLLFACLAAPIWLFQYVPLVDYPSHLARMEILSFYDRSPYFQEVYLRDNRLLPNLGMDLVVPLLRRFLPLELSGRIFLTSLLTLYCVGTVALAAVLHGRLTMRAVLLWPSFYNSALLWGFINYVTGVCLFVLWAALLVHTVSHDGRSSRAIHYLLLLGGAIACYAAHLTAFAMCCVTWGMLVLRSLAVERRISGWLLVCGTALVLPMALYAQLLAGGNLEARPVMTDITYDWRAKILQLPQFTRGYYWRQDALPTLLLLGAVGYCCVRALRRPWVSSALWPAIGFFAAYLFLPRAVNAFQSSFDLRFYWPAWLFLAFALPATGWSAREKRIVASVALLAWGLRLAELLANWKVFSRASAEMVEVLDQVPERARVYQICGTSADFCETGTNLDEEKKHAVLSHVVEYEIPRRKIYFPAMFAVPGAQPIVFRASPGNWSKVSIEQVARYDYVWALEPQADILQYLGAHADPVGTASGFTLWRLRKHSGVRVPPEAVISQ
jgi:hypothetical protein